MIPGFFQEFLSSKFPIILTAHERTINPCPSLSSPSLQVHKKDKKYKCMVCKKIFMLAASVGIRHGSRRYGVCMDCAESHPATQEGLESLEVFVREGDDFEGEEPDEDMAEEGEEPNDNDQSNLEGDTGAAPEDD